MALKKRGLGRGLDALLGDAAVKDTGTKEEKRHHLQTLPIEFLQRGKYQPRKDIDPEKLQELADSIKVQGVVQPIVVRGLSEDRYEIVAGERRWRAAQLAGLQEVPVVIKDIDDRAAMAIALIENIQREDLNPLEESEALKRLHDEFSLTHQQIADSVGKSRATVTNLLRLNELQAEVKKMLADGRLEMGHARALLALEGKKQIAAAQKIYRDGLTVRGAEKLIRNMRQEKQNTSTNTVDSDTRRLQEELTAKIGAKVTISHQSNGRGKLVMSYTSLDELENIINRIT